MKVNPDKCHLLVNESCIKAIKIAGNIIETSKCEKLMRIKIDSELSFKTHM